MPVGPPSHRRKRLGIRLKEARDALGLTQGALGTKIGRSQGWVNKVETAQLVKIRMHDLDLLFSELRISGALADELRDFARAPYNEHGVYAEKLPGLWHQRVEEIERLARVIKAVHLEVHDALTQCESYMRRQFLLAGVTNIEQRVQSRLARAAAVLGQGNPPECTFILSEACLHADMGDPEVMRAQLEHLLNLINAGVVTVLVKPFNAAFSALTYGWTNLQFGSEIMRDFVTVEYELGAATVDDDDGLLLFQRRWEQLRGASLGEYDSRVLIARALEDYKMKSKG